MNFNIIDGDNDYLQYTDAFAELYNDNNVKVNDIRERLQISRGVYRKLRRHCIQNGLIKSRRKPYKKRETYKTNPKNYSQTRRGDVEYFTVTKNHKHYCNCKTAKEAEYIVSRLRECDWDKTELPRIRREYEKMQ